MKLTLKEVTEVTRGAVRIAENDGAFSFYRTKRNSFSTSPSIRTISASGSTLWGCTGRS